MGKNYYQEERTIGEIIWRLRTEQRVTLEQLSEGICSIAQLARIEKKQQDTDHFFIDWIFQRLGKSTEHLEYVLPVEIYNLYELRYLIECNIVHMKLEEAEHLLTHYKRSKNALKPLHRQFILQEYAQIAWIRRESVDKILNLIQRAIQETISCEDQILKKSMILSSSEIRLLLFRWEVCFGTEYQRSLKELKQLLKYINQREMDTSELVKCYPYAVILLGKICVWKEEYSFLKEITKKALWLLREEGKILYMPEILEQYAKLLKMKGKKENLAYVLMSERQSLLNVQEKCGIFLDRYSLFNHTIRRFELDYELIRTARKALGISQEELSYGVCATETIARIEGKKNSPHGHKLVDILKKMQRPKTRVGTIVMTDQYEVLEMKREFNGYCMRFEYEKAREVLEEIENQLDKDIPLNQQYCEAEKTKIKYHLKEWSIEKCLMKLEDQLRRTLLEGSEGAYRYILSAEEYSILNMMAYLYDVKGNCEKSKMIWEKQLDNFKDSRINPIFHILEWENAMANLATTYEEAHETRLAINFCIEKIQLSMEAGKGNGIGRSLITLASALEQENDLSFLSVYAHGLNLLKLYKMEQRYQIARAYIFSSAFPFPEKINGYYHHLFLHHDPQFEYE